jgi:hypothetical protein
MPFAGFKDWDKCITHMLQKEGYNKETATKVCGALQSGVEKRNKMNCILTDMGQKRKMKYNAFSEFVTNEIKETDYMLTIPVTMTTEGVMNGGYKAREELMRSAVTFDGIPITFSHPPEGQITSLTQMEGYVKLTDYDPETGDVKGLANIFKTQENTSVVDLIRDGKIREVSIGFWSTDVFQNGIYDNTRSGEKQKYDYLETDIVGDHLAIMMPGERGACSPGMGCSLTNSTSDLPSLPNMNPGDSTELPDDYFLDLPTIQTIKKETNMTDENPPAEVDPKIDPPKDEGSNTSVTNTVVVDNSEQVNDLRGQVEKQGLVIDTLKKALEDKEKEPMVNEICEITGRKPEYFKDKSLCNVKEALALVREANVARHGLDTGQDNTDSPPGPDDTVDAYVTDPKTGELAYKEVGPKDEGVRQW